MAPKGAVCQIVGGVISPLLANVYLHQLDLLMRRYCDLPGSSKVRRRRKGLANFVYARYADDFVILCNGTHEQALEMRKEVHDYLRDSLHLALSMEKTKVTHLNDGFDFLGFRLKRCMGHARMVTKVAIPDKALEKHRNALQAALSPSSCDDSITAKLMAVNRIIGGWCRYYQYAGLLAKPFGTMTTAAFWLFAHWLGRKHKMRMPTVLRTFYTYRAEAHAKVLSHGDRWLARHQSFKAKRYLASPFKPNPYITQERIEREELPESDPCASWLWKGTGTGVVGARRS
jgi:RNA-directed DNA polymerase